MKLNLERCPFCGWKSKLITRKKTKNNIPYAIVCTSPIRVECFLYCGYDQIKNGGLWDDVIMWFRLKSDAVKTWNRRDKN